jgi:hypothetical protein
MTRTDTDFTLQNTLDRSFCSEVGAESSEHDIYGSFIIPLFIRSTRTILRTVLRSGPSTERAVRVPGTLLLRASIASGATFA